MDAFDSIASLWWTAKPKQLMGSDWASRELLPKLGLTLVLYFGTGWLGLLVPFTSGNVSPVWPASGVAIAAVILWGYEVLPAIFIGAFLVNFLHSIPLLASIGIAIGDSSSAFLGAYILRRRKVLLAFPRLRDVSGFISGALIGPLPAATVGTASIFLSHITAWSVFPTAWRVWWLGDAAGVLITTPLFFLYGEFLDSIKARRRLEFLLLIVATISVSLAIFWRTGLGHRDDVLTFVVFPFVLWAATRF